MKTKLIIACITYNHEKYLEQTLESFVTQKTNFPYEVYIADDCSKDRTPIIILEFAKKYPDIIKPMLRDKNVGVWQNWIEMADKIKSEYVALCEGDDYWIDDYKLQKQVDFLESNKEFAIAFHSVIVKWEDKRQVDDFFPSPLYRFNKTQLALEDLLKHNFIQTNSVVYRWRFIEDNIYDFLPKDIIPIDYLIHLLHAQKGNIFFQDELMAVYRRHDKGVWTGAGESADWYNRNTFKHLNFYLAVQKQFNYIYANEIENLASKALFIFCKNHNYSNIDKLKKEYNDIYNKIVIKFAATCSGSSKTKMKRLKLKIQSFFSIKYRNKLAKLDEKMEHADIVIKVINNFDA